MRNFPRSLMILTALAPLALAGAIAGPAAGATATPADTPPGCSHWNGSQPVNQDGSMDALAAISPCNVWAVGGTGAAEPFIEHWDGSSWSTIPSPDTGGPANLTAVSAASASDIWAVANVPPSRQGAVILHYDGSAWTQVPTPQLGSTTLLSVDARASNR